MVRVRDIAVTNHSSLNLQHNAQLLDSRTCLTMPLLEILGENKEKLQEKNKFSDPHYLLYAFVIVYNGRLHLEEKMLQILISFCF